MTENDPLLTKQLQKRSCAALTAKVRIAEKLVQEAGTVAGYFWISDTIPRNRYVMPPYLSVYTF